jgi:hypothetical protein
MPYQIAFGIGPGAAIERFLLVGLETNPITVVDDPVEDPDPALTEGYWRGTAWLGHPKIAIPSDGALR